MGTKRDSDTSVTLFEQLQTDPSDPGAWKLLFERYHPMIRSWCLKWGVQASDADDIAQDVLLKLLAAFRQYRYDPSRSFRTWLKTVTQHAWTDFARARLRTSNELAGQLEAFADSRDAVADLEQQLEDAFDRELLEVAMKRVEERRQTEHLDGLSAHGDREPHRRRGRSAAPDARGSCLRRQAPRPEAA